MSIRSVFGRSLAAIASAATIAASLSSASAMTLASPLAQQSLVPSQVENVWYCRWNCGGWHPGWGYRPGYGWVAGWRGPGWQGPGWGPVAVVGGLAVGAAVGAAVVAPVYGGPCWRRWIGPYGGVHWRRIC
jgi:hypothetical protein